MKKILPMIAFALLCCTDHAWAQKRRAKAIKAPKTELPAENPRFTEMLTNIQKIVFIDSIVIDKDNLLEAICTNAEEGRIAHYNDFFHSQNQPGAFLYVNQIGNKSIFSMANTAGRFHLYSSDLLGSQWSTPEMLKGFDEEGLHDVNYPYLMPDGQTLYFAAKGGDGLGGYDIYRTRFDAENGRYLKPENIGLPFNSESDDMLFVINEQDSIGFFATNRRQPEGKVCVYIFIPTETRQVYSPEETDRTTLRNLANISRIKDSWGSKSEHSAALRRLALLRSASNLGNDVARQKETFSFVINDYIVYRDMKDFKNPDNVDRMREVLAMRTQANEVDASLSKSRNYYATASSLERNQLRTEILKNEHLLEMLHEQIKMIEKTIRNTELNN